MTPNTLNNLSPPNRKRLWMAAIKPPMYSVAVMPIWVGSMVAFYQTRSIHWPVFFTFLAAATLILAWENLSNDVFDADTGVDVNKANSLVNMTGNKPLIFWLGNLCLALGLVGIGAIAYGQGDPTVIGLILVCCALGYIYQGPPFRLSYQGVGEFLCFFAFGPVAFAAVHYSQTRSWSGLSLLASVAVGLATSLILYTSHFNQVEDDRAAGKRSPVVRLGPVRAAALLPWACGGIYLSIGLAVVLGWFPVFTLASLGTLPIATHLCRFISAHLHDPAKLLTCRFIAVKLHFWLCLLLGGGFALGALR
jgi:2-carboxy-1,4-naphthoquinone phytyltransferase